MHVINSFSSRSPALMRELRKLHAVVKKFGLTLRADWLPSVANVCADLLSRRRDRDDWRVSSVWYDQLCNRFGNHTVDRFASPTNTRCPQFNSLVLCPGTEAVHAFTVHWGGSDNNWISPPFSQAGRVVDKVVADGATATVILPVWTAQAWWAPAVERATEAWLLPLQSGIFAFGVRQTPSRHPHWRMAVFRFVRGGNTSAAVRAGRATMAAEAGRRRQHGRSGPAGVSRSVRSWRVSRPEAALTELRPASCATGPSPTRRPTATTGSGAPLRPTATTEAYRPCPPPSQPSSTTSAGSGTAAPSSPSR